MPRNSRGRGGYDRPYRYEGDNHYGDQGSSRSMPRGRSARNDEYNNNMYDDGQPSGEYGRRDRQPSRGRGGYEGDGRRQRDSEEKSFTTTPPWRSVSRSRSHSPGLDPGQPSDTVIVENLPANIPTDVLHECILNNSAVANFNDVEVRIKSARGGRNAFVQFASVDEAAAFVKQYFPYLPMQLPRSDGAPNGRFEAYFQYARTRDGPEDQRKNVDDWNCAFCNTSNYSTRSFCRGCSARPVDESEWLATLTGATDAGDQPSHILVVYPILPDVTEAMMASDMKRLELEAPAPVKDTSQGAPKLKSTAPTENAAGYGARPGSLHRVFLMRTTASDKSARYGFVEFWTVEDANAAMIKFRKLKSFSVAAYPATVSHTHMGVFSEEDRKAQPEIEKESFNPLMNPAKRVRYRDVRLYPSQFIVTQEPPEDKSAAQTADKSATEAKNTTGGARDANHAKKRKPEGIVATPSKKSSLVGHMERWQRRQDELYGAKDSSPESFATASSVNRTPISASPLKKSTKAGREPPIKFNLSLNASLAQPAPPAGPQCSEEHSSPEKRDNLSSATDDDVAVEKDEVSFIDRDRLMCYLCVLKWTQLKHVDLHEKTDKHKAAMNDPAMVEKAHVLMAKAQKAAKQKSSEAASTPQYRDRAKERREAYSKSGMSREQDEAGSNGPLEPMPTPTKQKAPKPAQSKGAGMLAKMGWTSGAGLGANGEGRTEAIAMNAYQQGVGLGAEGSNLGDAAQLAERKTKNDPGDYRAMAQEKARERFMKMG
ncbi:unnamed protein product [Clonostachys byssicola]|uniref:RNA-binding protein n=1 Tax=Clonostachys byssicola TaxID=160290 RepID=A0A9N9USG2_9HYPO|nr:unnamed protein product [Clonostachys byssicola]